MKFETVKTDRQELKARIQQEQMEAMASMQAQKQRMREREQDSSKYTYNKEQDNIHQDTVSALKIDRLLAFLDCCIVLKFAPFFVGLIRCRVDTRESETFQYR